MEQFRETAGNASHARLLAANTFVGAFVRASATEADYTAAFTATTTMFTAAFTTVGAFSAEAESGFLQALEVDLAFAGSTNHE